MKKVYLSHNICLNSSYDFNIVKFALNSYNFIIVDNILEADTYIYAGCGVRGIWVENAINDINNALLENKNLNIIATGCFSAIEPDNIKKKVKTKNIRLMSFENIINKFTNSNITNLDNSFSQKNNLNFEGENQQRKRINPLKNLLISELQEIDKKYKLNITKKYKETTKGFIFYNESEPIEYITVTRGCPYQCSYCSIPLGRGGTYNSIPLGNIIKKINNAIENNINKILLLGDEIGNYGLGTKEMNLSKLLDKILDKTPIKVGLRYIEPNPFLKHYETIKKYCENNKIQLIYLPIQSGSNKILKLMNRTYSINDDLIQKILYLRNNTNVIFYTNWMVGFNSETETDFQKTIELVKKLNLQINMVIPFSERPSTKASKMKEKISIEVKKQRHTKLFNIIKDIKRKEFEKELLCIEKKERNMILKKIMEAENYNVQID